MHRQHDQHHRFIPACAGNTPACRNAVADSPVHPRVRGEHDPDRAQTHADRRFIPACAGNTLMASQHVRCWFGSSPRARGTRAGRTEPKRCRPVHPRVRGEHCTAICAQPIPTVHPRVRGEHSDQANAQRRYCGSSPRARGTRSSPVIRQRRRPVHPRVRGEHIVRRASRCRSTAVHPRVRGEHVSTSSGAHRLDRFIPACAGNTS